MREYATTKPECRYGLPAADQILFNRHYTTGYSYYFRQAKWALEIVDQDKTVERHDNFRADYRIPPMFRADPVDYTGSGYDRGHLVASANKRDLAVQNSETFLLSNMSPQKPKFNRGIWKKLEEAIRSLDSSKLIYETYVICGPIFDFAREVDVIGKNDSNQVTIPIPTHFFKSVLIEKKSGKVDMWSFLFPNEESQKSLSEFRVKTSTIEQMTGILLWTALIGDRMAKKKKSIRKMWS